MLGVSMALVYGLHAVFEALRGESKTVERVCIQRGLGSPRLQEIIDAARSSSVPISFEPKSWLDRKTNGGRHQGTLCFIAEMKVLGVEIILAQAASPGLLLVLDGIEDTRNVGAILRSAEVAGADGVLLPQRRSAPLGGSAIKASGGAASHIKVTRVPNIPRLIEELKRRGYWVAGLEAGTGNPLWSADFSVPTALVLGSEGRGLRPLVREKCDLLLSIPVRGKINSYNVSVAAGVALYEVIRQRSLTAAR
jgi:23S rRNA (guanosine2251-2'-O)-methyltransferase